ncbi:hypothetical protein QN277_013312 [Acacia crassicarpa]|uniref:Uncharacterized protein n=1 Tax=Acacia crassicarpa TaxID=499986 RepID=A0AAE1N3R3_9FABA|nr:hypothetical protein QN277_013312 [Acacia crassicarpa]
MEKTTSIQKLRQRSRVERQDFKMLTKLRFKCKDGWVKQFRNDHQPLRRPPAREGGCMAECTERRSSSKCGMNL